MICVLAQREMEKGRSPLVVRFRPFGAGIFKASWGLSSDDFFCSVNSARGLSSRAARIGSMSPAKLSLSMVVSPQSPLPFHLANPFLAVSQNRANLEDVVWCRAKLPLPTSLF